MLLSSFLLTVSRAGEPIAFTWRLAQRASPCVSSAPSPLGLPVARAHNAKKFASVIAARAFACSLRRWARGGVGSDRGSVEWGGGAMDGGTLAMVL